MCVFTSMSFWILLYLLFFIYNAILMRQLLILDKTRIESFLDVIITIMLVFIPIIGTIIIRVAIYNKITNTNILKRKIDARKFINKIFFID